MRLVIDGRESGTSTGRYVDKLIGYLAKLEPEIEIIVLTKAPRLDYLKTLAPSFKIIESNYKEFTFSEQLGLLRQINYLKPDLVHFTMTQQPVLYSGKIVTTIHDLTTARFYNPTKNWLVFKLKQAVYRLVIKKVAKKSAKIITASQFVKDDIAGYTGVNKNKIVITYEAADKISDTPEPIKKLDGSEFIVYVGRALPHKNLERLVQAHQKVRQTHPELLLVLAGKFDASYRRLKGYVNKNKAGGVVFTDFISDASLRWLYENTRAYVFPSLSEGFGLPGLEAMVHGAPVVSSSATCLPEIYGDAAVYFDPLDIEAMAVKITQVLGDKELAEDLAKKGRAQAVKYSWQKMAAQTLDIYKKILNK